MKTASPIRGDIYFADLGDQTGSVQSSSRPVIVIQNNLGNEYSPTTIVCPITSATKTRLPTHVYLGTSGGLIKDSLVLCEQLATINKNQLRKKIGKITDKNTLNKLNRALTISLGIVKEYNI
jgi:mRNA interferase MazF